jgi:hypothetical protein
VKIIRPLEITDAILTGSSLAEDDHDEFEMNDTYAEGDLIMVAEGLEILTLDVAPATDWDPGDIITGQSSSETSVAVEKITTLTYYVRERSGAYTLGEIVGVTGVGAKLADQGAAHPTVAESTDNVHKIYESLADSNTLNYPPLDVLETVPTWLYIGYTNRWQSFDSIINSRAEYNGAFTYQFTPSSYIDSMAFMNLENISTIRVVSTDPIEGVVYDYTKDLASTTVSGVSAIVDWYTYFFSTTAYVDAFVLLDIPPYYNAVIDVTITYLGAATVAKVGEIVLGYQANFGDTLYAPSIGIHDYSIKDTDDFGNAIITQRPYSRKMSCDVKVLNADISEVNRLLISYRTTPLVWIGSESYDSLLIYGYFRDYSIVISYPAYAICSIDVEGLI